MRGISFVASLYVAALCCLVLAGIGSYATFQFWSDGESALVESSDPVVQRYVKHGQTGLVPVDVTYVTPAGRIDVPAKFFDQKDIQRLADGEPIRIRFLKSEPRRIQFEDSPEPFPWGWLAGALVLMPLAVFAHSLLRKQTRVLAGG